MDDLTTLLRDAVEDVEPTERLGQIRTRVGQAEQGRRHHRWFATGAATLAAAAAVLAVAVVVDQRPDAAPGPGPVDQPTARISDSPSAYAVYYLGPGPEGPLLFREWHRSDALPDFADAVTALTSAPDDPDYSTPWQAGQIVSADEVDRVIRVELDASARERPAGMSDADAALALQQVGYTMQALLADGPMAVQFRYDGAPADQVLGVATPRPVESRSQLVTLNLVSVSDPVEGREVGDAFTATGGAGSESGLIRWTLADQAGRVRLEGRAEARGDLVLNPWHTEPIDVSDLPAGRYVFTAICDDPLLDADGSTPATDTRTVIVD